MDHTFDRLRAQATQILANTGLVRAEDVTLAQPKPNIPADLAFPVFAQAKASGAGNPAEFAKRIAEAATVPSDGLIGSVAPAGGFVNFAVHPERFAQAVLDEVRASGEAFGRDPDVGAGRQVVVEFSSPNIARKMHVGHLRTTVIGNSIRNILNALGYATIADNHLGDWGTQFGTLLAALDLWKLSPENDPDPVQSLVEVYARFNNAAKDDPALMDLARHWFKRLEDGDEWARATWQKLVDITLAEFDKTYRRLGVTFDTVHGESFFEPMLNEVVAEAVDRGVARIEPGGAVAVDFGENSLPSCLLRKTDGATLYQTRDVATCLWRTREYPDLARNIYVVGREQTLHFQQVFEIVRRMGYERIAAMSVHIGFGQVSGASGERFSMRRGDVIFLDEVLDEAITRARATIAEKIAEGKTELTPEQIDTVGEMIGIGSVIYFDLHQGPERNIAFDWDRILSFDGNTGLYIQYTYARCRSILRKAALTPVPEALTPIPFPASVGPFPTSGRGVPVTDAASASRGALTDSVPGTPRPEVGKGPTEAGKGMGVRAAPALLTTPEEQIVVKQLARLPHAVREAGDKFLPAVVADWTYTLAREFARFYHEHPVLDAATPELRAARLALVSAVAQGLENGLALLGIQAPERM